MQVDGNIILIGTSADGLKDQRPTLLNPVAAGVEVHAQAIEQMLTGDFLERPDWAAGAELLFLVVLGLILIFLLPWVGAMWCAIIGAAAFGAFGFSWHAYTNLKLLFDPVYPTIYVLLVCFVESLVSFLRNEAEKNKVRNAFGRYMSPALVEQLAENPERLTLGGEMRDMTLLFCDVRGFTSISELYKSDPQGLTSLIKRYWLYSHPRLGRTLRTWHVHGVIPARAKMAAVTMMSGSLVYVNLFISEGWQLPVGLGLVLASIATFIVSRPSRVPVRSR